jgi:hypothetical protein
MSLSSAVTRQRSDASATAFGIDQVGCYQPVVEQILGASAIRQILCPSRPSNFRVVKYSWAPGPPPLSSAKGHDGTLQR